MACYASRDLSAALIVATTFATSSSGRRIRSPLAGFRPADYYALLAVVCGIHVIGDSGGKNPGELETGGAGIR
jgi:hypothetical protein